MKASSRLTPGTLAHLLTHDPPNSGEGSYGNPTHCTLSHPDTGLSDSYIKP